MNKQVNKSKLRDIIEFVVFVVLIILVARFLVMSVRVQGSSMEPNLHDTDMGFMLRTNPINKATYHNIVVAAPYEDDKNYFVVKRVYALPYDTFEIRNNKVYVNDSEVDDKYRIKNTKMADYQKITLAKNEYFVLGDNRNNSSDSREIGPISEGDILAVNGVKLWPLNDLGAMN